MYIRTVTMWVKPDAVHAFRTIYSQGVIPALRETDGCLFAGLMQNVRFHQMCSSITLWRSGEKATAYEKSGLYERLLSSLKHLFHDSNDWQEKLPEDLRLDYTPTPERPVVAGFEEPKSTPQHTPALPHFVHLLALHSRSDKVGEFRQHFYANILSQITPRKGFIDAFLMHRVEQHHSFFVLSFWDGTAEPTGIMDSQAIEAIRERSKGVLFQDKDSRHEESLLFRCLTADWFRFNGDTQRVVK